MIASDDHGREAFAYLAIILLVMTTFAISYMAISERERGSELEQVQRARTLSIVSDREMDRIEGILTGLHVSVVDSAVLGGEDRLDIFVEGSLSVIVPESVNASLADLPSLSNGCKGDLIGWSIDCSPLLASVPGPVPEAPNGTGMGNGATAMAGMCEVLGVRTCISLRLRFSQGDAIAMEREKDWTFERRSLGNLASARLDRARSDLESGELHRVAAYMVSTYVQQKSMIGHGRYGYDPLVTEEEISSIVDLAAGLVTGYQLLAHDRSYLSNVTEELLALGPSGGDHIDPIAALSGTEGAVDPSTVLTLATGIMSDSNAPSAEDMIRPLFEYILDVVAGKLLSYLGLDGATLGSVGAAMGVIEVAMDVIGEKVENLFGIELTEKGAREAYDLLMAMLSQGGLESEEFSLMRRSYGTSDITPSAYPSIELSVWDYVFPMTVTWDDPEHEYYRDRNGTLHLGSEYVDPYDVYVGHLCSVVNVSATFVPPAMEARFEERLLADRAFMDELMEVMSGAVSEVGSGAFDDLTEKGRQAMEDSMDSLMASLSSLGGDVLWDALYQGWTAMDHPPVTGDPPVLAGLEALEDAISGFVTEMADEVLFQLEGSGFREEVIERSASLGLRTARWLNDRYDDLVDKTFQMENAQVLGVEDYRANCTIDVRRCDVVGTEVLPSYRAVLLPPGADVKTSISGNRPALVSYGIGEDDSFLVASVLSPAIRSALARSFEEMRSREVGIEERVGIVTSAILGLEPETRSAIGDLLEFAPDQIERLFMDVIDPMIASIREDILGGYEVSGTRALLPPAVDIRGPISPGVWGEIFDYPSIEPRLTMEACPGGEMSLSMEGIQETDPEKGGTPYRTFLELDYSRRYRMNYSLSGEDYPANVTSETYASIDLHLSMEIDGTYACFGVGYEPTSTLLDDVIDMASSAARKTMEMLSEGSGDSLGASLSSLSEVPPLVMDIIEGKDLDLGEVARVLTNVTMEITSTLRQGVKDLIRSLVEGAIAFGLETLLQVLDIDVLKADMRIGPLQMGITSDVRSLRGSPGRLLVLDLAVPSIGMVGYVGITRLDNDTVRFNGTVEIGKGPFYMRVELDPFLEVRQSVITIEGVYKGKEEDIRVSIKAPELVQYDSYEISLESLLGMEPNVFIAPIGTSVFFDAGFRIRYAKPDQLAPHINEIRINAGALSALEIFNPRLEALGGYTVEVRTNGIFGGAKRLEVASERFSVFDLGGNGTGMPVGPGSELLLRDPSGEVRDAMEIPDERDGWTSRDADGYGVFRSGEGTPGRSNGALVSFSFESLLVSLVVASLKEAWAEATGLYGLSFDTVVHFVQRALDLFVERVCGAIAELVLDVRLFISMKIALGTGASAGIGVELSFLAEGEAFARFLMWVYDNIKVFIGNIFDPEGAGDYCAFPMEILSYCHIELQVYTEVETPAAVSKMSPPGMTMPSSLTLAVSGRFNLALPFKVLGRDIGGWKVSAGVYVKEAPTALVAIFYDVDSFDATTDLWLLRVQVWNEDINGP